MIIIAPLRGEHAVPPAAPVVAFAEGDVIISAVVNGGDASTAFLLSPGRRCRRLYSASSHSSSSSLCSIGCPRLSSPSSLLPPRPTCRRRRRRCRRRWRRCFDLVVVVAPPLSFPPPPLFLWLTLLATSPSRPAIQRQPFRRCHHFRRGERRRDIHRAVVSIVVVGASRRVAAPVPLFLVAAAVANLLPSLALFSPSNFPPLRSPSTGLAAAGRWTCTIVSAAIVVVALRPPIGYDHVAHRRPPPPSSSACSAAIRSPCSRCADSSSFRARLRRMKHWLYVQ